MTRNLKFDLDIETNALLAANPEEFYSKAYLSSPDIPNNFRTLPGVKSKTKLANVVFGQVLQAYNCAFSPSTDVLDAIDIDVCSLSAMAELCQFDLEQSFLALQMTKGSNGDFTVPSFMSYYWNEMAMVIGQDIELLRWQGNTASEDELLSLCTGYLFPMFYDAAITGLYDGVVTTSNVLTVMESVLNAAPNSIVRRKADLRFYVSTNVANAYELKAAQGNTQTFVTLPLGLTFLGINVVACEGMPDNTILLTLKNNLIYAFDAEGDSKALKAINLSDSVAEPVLRTRANMKVGFHYTNPSEIVLYNPFYI
jgi:hypothetical protein